MNVTKKGNNLVIEIAMEKPRPSASGRSMLIAATRGAQNTGVMVNGKQVRVMLIAYIALDSVKKNPDTKAGAKGARPPESQKGRRRRSGRW